MTSSLKHAWRSLRRTPVFSVTAIVTLVLGIGSLAAMFAIVYGVLLEPLPYGRPDRLVSVALEARAPELRRILQPPGAYYAYRQFAHSISEIGFYRTGNANLWVDAREDAPERLTATWITASMIPMLEVRPMLGRSFTADEDRGHGPEAVILSESVWRSRFHGSPDAIGQKLYVNSVPRVVVGVMPAAFHFPAAETKVWLPAKMDRSTNLAGDFQYGAVARLAPGATIAGAQRDLAAAFPRMADLYPRLESGSATATWMNEVQPTPAVVALRDEVTHDIARTLWLLGAAAALVFLVACANVANLLLIRADVRQLELAVRQALGAGRLRIAGHFLGEALVLASAAGAVSLLAAWWAVRALVAFGPANVPRLTELGLGVAPVAFVVGVSLLSAIICTAVPALRVRGQANLSISLRDGARGETAGKARQRVRATIAALQIAIALVVVAGSTLLLRTFDRLYHERPGFETTNVITIWTQLPFARYGDSASVTFYARLLDGVRNVPGVRAAGLTSKLPLGDGEIREQTFRADRREQSLPVTVIDDGYLGAMNIPLVSGRGFEKLGVQRDGEIIVSRRAALSIWNDPTGAASIGRQLALAPRGPIYTVVGVAGDVRDRDLSIAPAATIYLPQVAPIDRVVEPGARRTLALVVKTNGAPESVVGSVREIVRELDPTVPIFNVETMNDVERASTARLSLMLMLMGAAAVITLVLGAIGLYGVMAYMVSLRRREFGVRVALGADPPQLARSVAAQGMTLIAWGVGAGLVVFAMIAPFLRAFLYGVGPGDPITLAGAVLALAVTGAFANWLPARRASRVDPADALRSE